MKPSRLNILLLSGSNPYDHSGIWAYDIYKSLTLAGHEVSLITKYNDDRLEKNMDFVCGKKRKFDFLRNRSLRNFLCNPERNIRKDSKYCMFSLNEKKNYIPTSRIMSRIPAKIDVILYLFPHYFLDSRNLFELNQAIQAPVFVIPVDMGSFTGGCHYAYDCVGYQNTCGCCPGLYSHDPNDLSHKNILYKKSYIDKTTICTLSNEWTLNLLSKSFLYREKPHYKMNVVVNEADYKPGDKLVARRNFSIPEGKKIIFFGAAILSDRRKGLSFLLDALNELYVKLPVEERQEIGIVVAGSLESDIKSSIPFELYSLGYLSHDQLVVAFQMADVYVSPSIQDAGPMMVIQSMMCGTPVVAFEIGNATDFIIDGETGYKVPLYDTRLLEQGIYSILKKNDEEKKLMSYKCRDLAMKKSSYEAFVDNFMEICKAQNLIV